MNDLKELKRLLLQDSSSRVSGVVQRITGSVAIHTAKGVVFTPLPTFGIRVQDLVIVESGQIIQTLGQRSRIPKFNV